MTAIETDALDRETAAKMTNAQLGELAKIAGVKVAAKATKAELLDALFAPGPENPAPVPVPTADEMIEVARRFLNEANADDQLKLRDWADHATPDEYERVMSAAAGRPAFERPPVPPEQTQAQTAIEKWHDAASQAAEIEPYRPTLLPGDSDWNRMQQIAQAVSEGLTLAEPLRKKPADVLLLLLAGHDVGIRPTVALNKIHVIKGRPSMSAELMRALVLDRGHIIKPLEMSATKVVMYGRRKEWGPDDGITCEWPIERASRIRMDGKLLTDKDNYKNYPEAMLTARATAELCRLIFPDVLAGVSYMPEELGAEVDASGAPVPVESTATNEPTRPKTKEEEAIEAGWDSKDDEVAAHRALLERVKALPDEQREVARAMREESGWPIRPRAKFDAFTTWVVAAEEKAGIVAEEAAPVAADAPKDERMAAAQQALAAAETAAGVQDVDTKPGLLTEPAVAEVVCGTCGNAAESFSAIDHEDGCPETPI